MHKQLQMHLLLKQCGTKHENYTCARLKLVKTLTLHSIGWIIETLISEYPTQTPFLHLAIQITAKYKKIYNNKSSSVIYLTDVQIQSDFHHFMRSLGIKPMTLVLLLPCSTV